MYYNSSWRISSKLHTVNQTLVGVSIGAMGALCAYLFETSQLESILTSSSYLSRLAYHPSLQNAAAPTNGGMSATNALQSTMEGKWFQAVISLIGTMVIFKKELKYLFNWLIINAKENNEESKKK